MNLKQLEVFLAVAETCSFSRGAEATFITQSTASQHISALESEFGIRLFDRTARGAVLTEGGKLFARHARQLLTDAGTIREAIARFRGIDEAELRVGGSNIPGTYMIPSALPLLLERFPGLRLHLWQGDSREVVERIVDETLEIGVVGSRCADDRVEFEAIGSDEIILVAPAGHAWYGKRVAVEDLAGESFILREAGSGTATTVTETLKALGAQPGALRVRAFLGSNEAVKTAVAAGIGLSFLSRMSVAAELQRGEIGEVAVEGVSITRTFYLVSRARRELSPAASAFAAAMREIYSE